MLELKKFFKHCFALHLHDKNNGLYLFIYLFILRMALKLVAHDRVFLGNVNFHLIDKLYFLVCNRQFAKFSLISIFVQKLAF